MKKIFLLILIVTTVVFPKGKGSIRGYITDSSSGEAIAYANVIVKGSNLGGTSNTKGYYFIASIPEGKQTIRCSYLGYVTKDIEVEVKANEITQVNIEIVSTDFQLKELSIIGKRSAKENETDLGLQSITPKDIEMMPTGVEADIFRYIQTSPGVSSTGDVTSRYFVRGGGSDQNLLLLNGVTVYNPFHALGIFSVIDPEMISVMDFYKGGFPAELSGRLSSVINVVTKDGNRNNYSGTASASLVSAKAMVEGPIPYGSFIATGRKSYISNIMKKYFNNKSAPFDFYDFSFKANYSNPNTLNGKISFHSFLSNDKINNNDPLKEDYSVDNKIFGLNWYQIWGGSPLFSNFSLSTSLYNAEVFPNYSSAKPRLNEVTEVAANFDFVYMYDSKDELHFGLQSDYLNTRLKLENVYGSKVDFSKNGSQLKGYANYKLYRYDNVGFDIGLRINFLNISKKGPFLLEPRINVVYKPTPLLSLKAAFGRYSQEVASLTNENEIISIFEPWLIIPEYLNPSEATHFILGVENYFTENLSINIEGYYKYMDNLFDVNNQKYSFMDRDYINVTGDSYGIESTIKFQNSFFYVQGGYSYSFSYKYRKNLTIIPRYDLRHSGSLALGIEFGDGWNFNSSFSISSGMPFTPIIGYYDRPEINPWSGNYMFGEYSTAVHWDERNNGRLPMYHRLDISLNKELTIGIAEVTLGANILNIYNQKNIFYFMKDTGEKIYMLPFLPSVNVKVKI